MSQERDEAAERESRFVSAGEIKRNALTRRPSFGDNSLESHLSTPQEWSFTDKIHGWNECIERKLSHRRHGRGKELERVVKS